MGKVLYVSDRASWALDEVATELERSVGGSVTSVMKSRIQNPTSTRVFLSPDIFLQSQHLGKLFPWASRGFVNFFHGVPSDGEDFAARFRRLEEHKEKLRGVRVTNPDTANQLESSGLTSNIAVIPLGVELVNHSIQPEHKRRNFRQELKVGPESLVIGSFQKDGIGWGQGELPKLEKGPDIFADTLSWLRETGTPVHALLTGPSRGYVISRLRTEKIPFTYFGNISLEEVKKLYGYIDCYLVSSRTEGGPRAILETLASGRPVVSTRVGQAMQVLNDTEFGVVSESFRPEDLADAIRRQMSRWKEDIHPAQARSHASRVENKLAVDLWKNFLSNG